MDIKIRKLDPYTIKKFDEQARKKNISREQYLRNQLETLAIAGDIKSIQDRYEDLCSVLRVIIEQNTKVYEKVLEKIDIKEREIFE